MGDADNALATSKKRAAGREISKDNPGLDDDDSVEEETGTFKRASEEVLATRRIVKVRRNPTTSAPSSNPFAGISLFPPTGAVAPPSAVATAVVTPSDKVVDDGENDTSDETQKGENKNTKGSEGKSNEPVAENAADKESGEEKENKNTVNETTIKPDDEKTAENDKPEEEKAAEGDKTENEEKDNGTENVDQSAEETPLSSFQQLSSSQNAFTGLAGTGFTTSTFTFGSVSKDGSFGFGLSNNGSSPLFNSTGPSIVSKNESSGFQSLKEVPVETGEENEKTVFSADSVLFEFLDGTWKERGKGELKVNISTTEAEDGRVVMRARGNYRLILNANLYPDMKLTNMDKKGITFACMNSTGEGKGKLSTVALKFKDPSIVEEFRAAVTAHKGKLAATVLKTPENSPKASDQ